MVKVIFSFSQHLSKKSKQKKIRVSEELIMLDDTEADVDETDKSYK